MSITASSETNGPQNVLPPDETSPLLPSKPSPEALLPPLSPPDGGLRAWTQVLVAHLLNINVFGHITSFGIFQELYTSTTTSPLYPIPSPSQTSWIGSIRVLLIFLLGTLTGALTDAGYLRRMLYLGLILQLAAVLLTSFATTYWHVLLAQGLLQGLGDGLLYCPALALVSTYFSRRRTMALACVACGGATGGIIFPALARALLFRAGFAWTVRAMGIVMAVNGLVAVVFARTRLPARKMRGLVRWEELREPGYALFTMGVFLCLGALFFAYYYIPPFAVSRLQAPPETSLTTLHLLNFSGLLGRLLPAYLSDTYLGPLQTLIPSALFSAALFALWPLITTLTQLYLLVSGLGFFLASIQSTFPAAAAGFAKGKTEDVGVRMGMVFGVVAWGCGAGPPVGGWLIEMQSGGYGAAQVVGGVCMAVGGLCLVAARVVEVGWGWGRRV